MSQQEILTLLDAKKYFGFEIKGDLCQLSKASQSKVINAFTIHVLRSMRQYKINNRLPKE